MTDIILNIETSTEVCSVALQRGEQLLGVREAEEPMSHTRTLTELISALLETCEIAMPDLTAVSVSSGPGSYTGLRVGMSTAKGICYAGGLPLIGVSTLKALADEVIQLYPSEYSVIFPMLDARRMEVYTTVYDGSGKEIESLRALILEESTLDKFLDLGEIIAVVGPGAKKFFEHFESVNAAHVDLPVSAKNMVKATWGRYNNGLFEDLAYGEPHYLKPANVTQSRKRLL